jgi:hypothetical protein
MPREKLRSNWSQVWVAVTAVLAAVTVVLAFRADLTGGIQGWALPIFGVVVGFFTAVFTTVKGHTARAVASWAMWPVADGMWAVFAVYCGFSAWVLGTLIGGAVVLAAIGHFLNPTEAVVRLMQPASQVPIPVVGAMPPVETVASARQTIIRRVTKQPITVTQVEPWDVPANGERIYVDLPVGMPWTDLADYCAALQGAWRLLPGCVVRVLPGDHQGSAVLDVMLRDSLADTAPPEPKNYSPASIYHSFKVLRTPRNEPIEVCLREQSMVVGGTTGAGKTTLLHRIILWLARCVDALIWIIDLNGGGLGAPWVTAWAQGRADRPTVDWIADSEVEAAVMTAVGVAIAKDRKTDSEGIRRKREANTTSLPVDARKAAVVILTDEGGEVAQAVGLLGLLVSQRISRIVQIGRAEAVRVVMSVLRGTSDLLDKNLRVNAATRICLRMEEPDEYVHVLGVTPPGRADLLHKGTGFVRRGGVDPKPVFAISSNFLLDEIDEASVATAHLRPALDDRAQLVASRVRISDVLEGKAVAVVEDDPGVMAVLRDVDAGAAYSRRWERYAPKLALLRGEEPPDDEVPPPAPAPTPTTPASSPAPGQQGSVLDELLEESDPQRTAKPTPVATKRQGVDLSDQAAVDEQARQLLADLAEVTLTARDVILQILNSRPTEMLTSAEIGMELERRGAAVSRTHRQEVLKELREEGLLLHANGKYQSSQAAA